MAGDPIPKMAAAEYLAMERASPFKSEFVGGEVFAMSGGPIAHGQLICQMARELADALDEGPCTVNLFSMGG